VIRSPCVNQVLLLREDILRPLTSLVRVRPVGCIRLNSLAVAADGAARLALHRRLTVVAADERVIIVGLTAFRERWYGEFWVRLESRSLAAELWR
jgi:hypothetical protein